MNELSVALRLADALKNNTSIVGADQIAAELRRLHAENLELHSLTHPAPTTKPADTNTRAVITPWNERPEVLVMPDDVEWTDTQQNIVDGAKAAEIAELRAALTAGRAALAQPCKYNQAAETCTLAPMDCQCAIDAALTHHQASEPAPASGEREALIARLNAHAEMHAEWNDAEQWQWADDLRKAADMLAADAQCTRCKVVADDDNEHIQRAYKAEAKLAQQVAPPPIPAPQECKTEAEKTAYAFGWWKALEAAHINKANTAQQVACGVPMKEIVRLRVLAETARHGAWSIESHFGTLLYGLKPDVVDMDEIAGDAWVAQKMTKDDANYLFAVQPSKLLALLDRLIARQVAVPQGWKLVPVEPTEEMLEEVDEEVGGHCYSCTKWTASEDDCKRVYAAMLTAAPQPPQGE